MAGESYFNKTGKKIIWVLERVCLWVHCNTRYIWREREREYTFKFSVRMFKRINAPARWLSWLEHHPTYQNDCGFNPWSRNIPRLWVPSLVWARTRGSWLMFFCHNDGFLPFFFLSALSKKKINKIIKIIRVTEL